MEEKVIIVGGGVGPMAGVELHRRIIENTITDGTDQSHLEVYHLSRSADIPDRTQYLLGKERRDPVLGMFRTFKIAYTALEERNSLMKEKFLAVGGIPCNTFHAPAIFNRFLDMMNKNHILIKIINMIEETAWLINETIGNVSKVGLLSTTGTRHFGVYRRMLESSGIQVTEVPENLQDELHDTIYNREWGIKAVSPVSEKAKTNFERYAGILAEQGVQAIILGCTEIPLALTGKTFHGIPLIDPMVALARGLIRDANPKKLKPINF